MSYTTGDYNVYSDLNIGGDMISFAQSNSVILGPGDLFVNGSLNVLGDIITFSTLSNLAIMGSLYASGDTTAFANMLYPTYSSYQTPIVPVAGIMTLCNISNAFPGVANSRHLLAYKNVHPTPYTAPIVSMNLFRGLTALSPSFDFTTMPALGSNLIYTLSNSILVFSSAAVSPTLPAQASYDLGKYTTFKTYQGPTGSSSLTFALSNTSPSLPSGVTLTPSGVLNINSGSTLINYRSTVVAINSWSNISSIPLAFSFLTPSPPVFSLVSYQGTNLSMTPAGAIIGVVYSPNSMLGNATGYIDIGDAPDLISGLPVSLFFATPPPVGSGISLSNSKYLSITTSNSISCNFSVGASNSYGQSNVQPFSVGFVPATPPSFSLKDSQGSGISMSNSYIVGNVGPAAIGSGTFSLGSQPGSGSLLWTGVTSGTLPGGWSLFGDSLIVPPTQSQVTSSSFSISASNSLGVGSTTPVVISGVAIESIYPLLLTQTLANNGVTLGITNSNISITGTNSFGASAAWTTTLATDISSTFTTLDPTAATTMGISMTLSNLSFLYSGGVSGYSNSTSLYSVSPLYGTSNLVTLTSYVQQSPTPMPIVTSSNLVFGLYNSNALTYPATWSFNTTNYSSIGLLTTNMTLPNLSLSSNSNSMTLTGNIAQQTLPTATFAMSNSIYPFKTSTSNSTFVGSQSPSPLQAPVASNLLIPQQNLGTGTDTISLPGYFTGGTPVLFYLTQNPQNNASISSTNLVINAAWRNTSYTLIVAASNAAGIATQNIVVVESAMPNAAIPSATQNPPSYATYNGNNTWTISWSFNLSNFSSCTSTNNFGGGQISVSGLIGTLSGNITTNTTPTANLTMSNAQSGYTTSYSTPNPLSFTGNASPGQPAANTPSANQLSTSPSYTLQSNKTFNITCQYNSYNYTYQTVDSASGCWIPTNISGNLPSTFVLNAASSTNYSARLYLLDAPANYSSRDNAITVSGTTPVYYTLAWNGNTPGIFTASYAVGVNAPMGSVSFQPSTYFTGTSGVTYTSLPNGLPSGWTTNGQGGVFTIYSYSGATQPGSYTITVNATDMTGTTSANHDFSFTNITAPAPAFNNLGTVSGTGLTFTGNNSSGSITGTSTSGVSISITMSTTSSYSVTYTSTVPTTYGSIGSTTGILTISTSTVGSYTSSFTVTATNSLGNSATYTLNPSFSVTTPTPVSTPAPNPTFGQQGNVQFTFQTQMGAGNPNYYWNWDGSGYLFYWPMSFTNCTSTPTWAGDSGINSCSVDNFTISGTGGGGANFGTFVLNGRVQASKLLTINLKLTNAPGGNYTSTGAISLQISETYSPSPIAPPANWNNLQLTLPSPYNRSYQSLYIQNDSSHAQISGNQDFLQFLNQSSYITGINLTFVKGSGGSLGTSGVSTVTLNAGNPFTYTVTLTNNWGYTSTAITLVGINGTG